MSVSSNLTIAASNTENANLTSFVTISAVAGIIHQVIGFSGASDDQAFKTFLDIGGTTVHRLQGVADTTEDIYFGELGPVSGKGEDITVVTYPAASGNCTANLQYRKIF